MTLVKNTTAILAVFMLLMGFAFMSSPAYAAPQERTDVCETEDAEGVDSEEVDEENESDESDKNDAEDQCEQAESERLASQAKISESEARTIALKEHSGTVREILLGNDEDDNGISRIVYEIEIVDGSGSEIDVKVDAKTGEYLGVDEEDGEGDDSESDAEGMPADQNTQALQAKLISLLQQLIALLKTQ